MVNYLCSVSGRFPENYEIGLRANLWGVEEKFEIRIRTVVAGNLLVFIVGGEFRSIHKIISEPFYDDKPLWPEKDRSLFPHRIKISVPIMEGRVPVKVIANQISFMKGKSWSATLMGHNGIFNNRLTDADVKIIEKHMTKSPPRAAGQ